MNSWGNAEWRLFRGCAEKLEFSSNPTPSGVRLTYYLSDAAKERLGLRGLVEDGSFELSFETDARWLGVVPAGRAIVARSEAGRESRGAYERIIWQRLVMDVSGRDAAQLGEGAGQVQCRGVNPCPDAAVNANE